MIKVYPYNECPEDILEYLPQQNGYPILWVAQISHDSYYCMNELPDWLFTSRFSPGKEPEELDFDGNIYVIGYGLCMTNN